MPELSHGSLFAGHEILGVAGRGGMGVVYRARQLDLDRLVALKVITPELAQDPSFRERFIRESRVAASIDHPNVIPVFAAGESDGVLYLTMRYVEGDDLRTLVRRDGPLPAARAAQIVRQVGAALDAAHARGIVHRDVKPANVLLDGAEHAYLTDFGLTKRVDSISGQTRAGSWVGTLGYVAPEQIRGDRVDARTDVYALGCVLFHVLTGDSPYRRDSDEATLWAHLNDPPPSVTGTTPAADLPSAFDAVVARALAKDPADRFPSAGDLGRAALAAADGRGDLATAAGRVVATGAAAPAGADDRPTAAASQETRAAAGAPEPATAAAATRRADGVPPEGPARRPRRPRLVAAGFLVVAAIGAGVAVVLSGGDAASPARSRTTVTTTTRPAVARVAGPSVAAGSRPNDVVAGPGRRVWVVSNPDDRMTIIDGATGRRTDTQPTIGRGAQSVAAGFGRIWIVKNGTNSLVQLDDRAGRRSGPPVRLPAGLPVRVRAGEGAVWVGIRTTAPATPDLVETVAKVDPRTGAVRTISVPGGVQDLDVGAGAVWVVGRGRETLTRIDVRSGAQRTFSVGRAPRGVTIGGGSAWVANSAEGSVTRISTSDPRKRSRIAVGTAPRGIAYGAGDVWVTNELDDSVTRIDAATGTIVGAPITGVGRGPAAISARGDAVWVVSPSDGSVARISVP